MTKCSQCGAENRDGAKFCESCGAKLEAPVEEKPAVSFCPNCGAEVAKGSAFCPSCGAKLGAAPAPAPASEPEVAVAQAQPANPQAKPATKGPIALVRSLVVNISSLVFIFLMGLAFVVPVNSTGSSTYVTLLTDLFKSFGGMSFNSIGVVAIFYAIVLYVLPGIGFLVFGIMGLINAIQGLIRKQVIKYGTPGAMIGFYAPFYMLVPFGEMIFTGTIENQLVEGTSGFTFGFMQRPSFIVFFVAVLLFVIAGATNDILKAVDKKKPLVGPILKACSVICGFIYFLFSYTAIFAMDMSGFQYSASSLAMFLNIGLAEFGDGMTMARMYGAIMILLVGIMAIVAVITAATSMGKSFNKNSNGPRITSFVFMAITMVFGIFGYIWMSMPTDGSPMTDKAFPSGTGYIVIICALAYMVLGIVSSKLDEPIPEE